jgi:hypothetical protein
MELMSDRAPMHCLQPGAAAFCQRERGSMLIARITIVAVLTGTWAPYVAAAQPGPETLAAFDGYVAQAEAQIRQEESSPDSFLSPPLNTVPGRTELEARLRRGEVLVERRGVTPTEIPGGLIHHWRGITFIPNATIAQVFTVLQDYDHLARYYRPQIVASRLISRNGDDFHISMRLSEHKIVTVVLDTAYEVQYGRLDAVHQYSLARSTRIAEIANAGERAEYPLAEGYDHGFLWRLNTYWRFVQRVDGVFVQCEAISLTRDVPTGLGWLIGPFVKNIPRESLQFSLRSTRAAVVGSSNSGG